VPLARLEFAKPSCRKALACTDAARPTIARWPIFPVSSSAPLGFNSMPCSCSPCLCVVSNASQIWTAVHIPYGGPNAASVAWKTGTPRFRRFPLGAGWNFELEENSESAYNLELMLHLHKLEPIKCKL
jgi:hypothetical protein